MLITTKQQKICSVLSKCGTKICVTNDIKKQNRSVWAHSLLACELLHYFLSYVSFILQFIEDPCTEWRSLCETLFPLHIPSMQVNL